MKFRRNKPPRFPIAALSCAAAALFAALLAVQPLFTLAAQTGPHWSFTPTMEIILALVLHRPAIGDVGHLLITEVLYDPSASQGEVEWIEIFNPTGDVIALDDYKIGDEETIGGSEGMFQFPAGAVIGVGQTVVIAKNAFDFKAGFGFDPDFEFSDSGSPVPDMVKYAAWAGGSVSLTNSGDEVLLLDIFDDLVDAVSWGNSNWAFDPDVAGVPKGTSIERSPAYVDTDSAADWLAQPSPTPGQVDLTPPVPTPTVGPSPTPFMGGLLIAEVLFDPDGPEPKAEWFEIHNTTAEAIDISGFKVGDEESPGGSEGMYAFPAGSLVPAGGVIVVANDAVQFAAEHGWQPDFELAGADPDVPDLVKYTVWSGGSISLSNSGDELLLLDLFDNLVDAVSWGSSTWAFDPAVPGVPEGHSIERFPAGADTDSAGDWRGQESPNPGDLP
ncbi:MAG TPA: lamin tail domain-containing protein [Anaerolineales bacterium]|nr:lamin tail domain-containing protein [Anaerolineales bacterium]